MPEASLNEYHGFELRKNYIRLTGQLFTMQSKTKSSSMQNFPDQDFGSGILAFNASHHLAALFYRNDINQ